MGVRSLHNIGGTFASILVAFAQSGQDKSFNLMATNPHHKHSLCSPAAVRLSGAKKNYLVLSFMGKHVTHSSLPHDSAGAW